MKRAIGVCQKKGCGRKVVAGKEPAHHYAHRAETELLKSRDAHGSGTARRVNENTSLKHEKPGILQEAEYCNLYCANCHKTEDTDKMNKLHAKIRILRLERLGLSPEPP